MANTTDPYYDFGPFRADPVDRELLAAGQRVALTPRAFDTLLVLVEQAGRVVEKSELLAQVWPGTFVAEATLTQNIYTLRKTLERHAADGPPFIETVPRRGYRFSAPVAVVQRPRLSSAGTNFAIRNMAVLPFVPLGSDDGDELLGLGMADALITRLSGLNRITVRPTSAVLKFADRPGDAVEAGRALGVDAVLEGTMQKTPQQVRVTVQLVTVSDASTAWAGTFDAVYTDLFSVQDEISRQVADMLRVRLGRDEAVALNVPTTRNVEAHQAYVRGRYHWNARTAEGLEKAIAHFHEALRHDERYVLALTGLADSYSLLPLYGTRHPDEAFPEAKRFALRALELDDRVAETHTSLAYVRLFHDWDWSGARAGFDRALELDPGYPTAHHWLGFLHAALGRHEEAVDSAMRALELDPLSMAINSDLGLLLYFGRRFDEAIGQFEVALELNPQFAYARFGLALAYAQLGRVDDALRESGLAVELSGGGPAMLAAQGYAHGIGGHPEEARRILTRLDELPGSPHLHTGGAALVHCGLGDIPATLQYLSRACDERSRFVVFLGVWPVFDPLRAHAEFERLLRRVGLP